MAVQIQATFDPVGKRLWRSSGRRAAALALVLSGCTLMADADREQCATDTDCAVRGGDFSSSQCIEGYCELVASSCGLGEGCSSELQGDEAELSAEAWACVDSAEPDAELPRTLSVTVPLITVFGQPMPDVPTRLCRRLDPACTQPEAEIVSDAQGLLRLQLPGDFQGYLEIEAEGFYSQLYFLPSRLEPDTTLRNASMSPVGVIEGLGAGVGAAPDPERGHIVVTAETCSGPAEGVTLSAVRADSRAIVFYVVDGVPSGDLTATTEMGSGGYLNFPPGIASLVLSDDATSERLATLALIVRANFITTVAFGPEDLASGS